MMLKVWEKNKQNQQPAVEMPAAAATRRLRLLSAQLRPAGAASTTGRGDGALHEARREDELLRHLVALRLQLAHGDVPQLAVEDRHHLSGDARGRRRG